MTNRWSKTSLKCVFHGGISFCLFDLCKQKTKAVASLNSIIPRPEVMDIKGTIREFHPFKICEKNVKKKKKVMF